MSLILDAFLPASIYGIPNMTKLSSGGPSTSESSVQQYKGHVASQSSVQKNKGHVASESSIQKYKGHVVSASSVQKNKGISEQCQHLSCTQSKVCTCVA